MSHSRTEIILKMHFQKQPKLLVIELFGHVSYSAQTFSFGIISTLAALYNITNT